MTLISRKVVVSGPAGRDLQNLYEFARQFDEQTAHRLVKKLVDEIIDLARKGVEGSSRSFLPAHVRAFPFEKHCFYFTVDDEKLTLLRVLHGSQSTSDIAFDPQQDDE